MSSMTCRVRYVECDMARNDMAIVICRELYVEYGMSIMVLRVWHGECGMSRIVCQVWHGEYGMLTVISRMTSIICQVSNG